MKKLFVLVLIFNTIFSFSQNLIINISENQFGVDESNSLIVSHIENYKDIASYSEIVINLDEKKYYFSSIPVSLQYSNSYLIMDTNTSKEYTLYFTELPIVSLESTTTIPDEPKVLANFIYSDNEQTLVSNVGIEIRGGISQTYPKKNYDLEFWEDTIGDENRDVQFGKLRDDDDWILNGLYNEPLRIRSYTANKLWLELHTLNYADVEPKAKSGANIKYVEMFLNGQYNGIYNLSEQVDKKQLKLKSFKNDEIRGELYKGVSWGGGTLFSTLPNYNNWSRSWGGYELKYPKEDDITDWSSIYQFKNFVINSSDSDFNNTIWNEFDVDNYSDYFLFLNLLRATDNRGKNIYLAKYKANKPYFYVPWDLDGCFGTIWNGDNKNITNDILQNGFISRVIDLNPNDIASSISKGWFNLRENIFSNDVLSNSISQQYNLLQNNKVYERESIVYPNYSFSQEDLSYLLTWLENRLAYLDTYFGETLSTNNSILEIKNNYIYPNPTKDRIHVSNTTSLIGKEFKVYNTLGQLMIKGVVKHNFISVKNLETGSYLLKVDLNLYKFIKK